MSKTWGRRPDFHLKSAPTCAPAPALYTLHLEINALHEHQYLPCDLPALRLDRSIREITLERLRTRRNKTRVTFTPDGQQRNLRLAEILMDRQKGVSIASVVVEQIKLMFLVLVSLLVLQEVQRPIGGIDKRQIGVGEARGILRLRGG